MDPVAKYSDFQFQRQQKHRSFEDDQSRSSTEMISTPKRLRQENTITTTATTTTDEGYDGKKLDTIPNEDEIMMVKRSRGRPSGSKNKPNPPIIITRDNGIALSTRVMEISDGCDIIGSISTFARREQIGVCILSATGIVTSVTLKQSASPGINVMLRGAFEILSLSGSILPPPAPPSASGLTIYLAGGEGQIVGGIVVGKLLASGPVFIMSASFRNASYEKLPLEDDDGITTQGDDIGSLGDARQNQQHFHLDADPSLYHGSQLNLLDSLQLPPTEPYRHY